MALHIALALALAETFVLAGVLLVWAKQVPGARLLVVFLLGVAAWIVGNELPNWLGPDAMPWALRLLATVPLTSAAFSHFCLRFCRVEHLYRPLLALAYAVAGAACVLSLAVTPGEFVQFPAFTGIQWVVVPNWAGWTTSLVWALFAGAGVTVLLHQFIRTRDARERRQLAAVGLSCALGLFSTSGYGFAALGIPQYPWQVLAMPAYPVILVYGILRYQVFVANAWARRALAWTLLIGLGLLTVPLTLLLPFDSRWASGAVIALVCLALNGPVRQVAARLVYPGGTVTAGDLQAWRRDLGSAGNAGELAARASALLSRRVGLGVEVHVSSPSGSTGTAPSILCETRDGHWHASLQGWDAAPPGPRRLAELFAQALADAADRVEQTQRASEREREQQLQARLAELGALAASVAHDLRNPLNIIHMAVAGAPQDTRHEVADQVRRISRLAEDLLDYAKPWQVNPIPLDVARQVREAARRTPAVELGDGLDRALEIHADPVRLEQVLTNLLENARAAPGARHVRVEAEQAADAVRLYVCDDGAGVPHDLRERLFEPFASRSPGGTGLGLAIVARIMRAHGGSVCLTERPPWSTCFMLTFPSRP